VTVFGYINFASDRDRTWNVQECSICVRIASSFAMIAYMYIYISTCCRQTFRYCSGSRSVSLVGYNSQTSSFYF